VPRFDLSPADLKTYLPDIREPADFDAFWQETLAASRAVARPPVVSAAPSPLHTLDVFDVTFSGFAGDPIRAWLTVPRGIEGPLPAVVEYNGYGGGRGRPFERSGWASSGYATSSWTPAARDRRGEPVARRPTRTAPGRRPPVS